MAVVLSGTDIRFLSGIPFRNDYQHTRWFKSVTEQQTYFNSRNIVHRMTQANFTPADATNMYIACDASVEALYGTNYLMFKNATHNRWFYAFVTKIEYVQRNRTNVYFEIDVLQTWRFLFQFKPSYIAREHCQQHYSAGTPYINTLDEGLDYGKEYDIVSVQHFPPKDDFLFLVIVAKSLLHKDGELEPNTIKSTINGSPQPLSYYVHPFKRDGSALSVSVGSSNFEVTKITDLLSNIYSQDDAVNNIVSLYVTEHIGINPTFSDNTLYLPGDYFGRAMISDNESMNIDTIYVKELSHYSRETIDCGNKYSGFRAVPESKLLMYPYCITILDDMKGNRLELKNEYINGTSLIVRKQGSLGVSNKVAYTVPDYNTHDRYPEWEKLSIGLETSMINNNPNDVPIITDMLSAYLQGNKNSLENQRNSIMFNGAMNAVGGAVGGAMSGGIGGIIGSTTGLVQGAGNTVLQLQGLQAKQADISNTPPQLVKMGGNTAFDYGFGLTGFFVIKKQIKPEYVNKLASFFNMYGYKMNEVKMPNLETRKYWNYIQTVSCNIVGDLNNDTLNKLKSIFDNGITLWHTNDIGNYNLENEVN